MLKKYYRDLNKTRWVGYLERLPLFSEAEFSYKTWMYIWELNFIIKMLTITKKNNSYYFNLPRNNQRTRSRKPKKFGSKWKFLTYNLAVKFCKLKKIKLSKNFILFDYINRLWYKQWYQEWLKIRTKRLHIRRVSYKNRTNINFPILQYKHVIRNFKVINKKKQKFVNHFNLGFFFYEYVFESYSKKKFNRRTLRRKYSKFFIMRKVKSL